MRSVSFLSFLPFFPLLAGPASAGELHSGFDGDAGGWSGGRVEDGVLVVEDGEASLALGPTGALEGSLRLRVASPDGVLRVHIGDAAWQISFAGDGAVSLGETTIPLPQPHLAWETEPEPVLEPGEKSWEAGSVLHCDVIRDPVTGHLFLFYTGEMAPGYGYRQIGLATSEDGIHWTRYTRNPVLTIDYGSGVEGVHVHMPSVALDESGAWHMFYACYQNDVGNRICHATSDDGSVWVRHGVALDLGAPGDFDSGSLREPDVLIGSDGLWHMLYNGTVPDQHYGPTGYATSPDGWTWTKQGAITGEEDRLQGGSLLETPYGIEQWHNCDDAFCYARSSLGELESWTRAPDPVLVKGWAAWNSGYIQAPSVLLEGTRYEMWFNAYDYAVDDEVLAHATSRPSPGTFLDLGLHWDGSRLSIRSDDGPLLDAPSAGVEAIRLVAFGRAELDEVSLTWEPADQEPDSGADSEEPGDTEDDPDDTSALDDSATDPGKDPEEGCGCASSPTGAFGGAVLGLGLLGWRRRRDRQAPRNPGP